MNKFNKRTFYLWLTCSLIFAAILIFDLVSKHFIFNNNQKFIEGFISFSSTQNTGAAWGLFAGGSLALTIFSGLAIVALLAYMIFSKNKSFLFFVGMGFILSGALGNFVDRVAFGYVRDFIKLDFMSFPIFNIADCALTVGIVILFIYVIIGLVKSAKENRKGQPK